MVLVAGKLYGVVGDCKSRSGGGGPVSRRRLGLVAASTRAMNQRNGVSALHELSRGVLAEREPGDAPATAEPRIK
jgi:hypothetical protein